MCNLSDNLVEKGLEEGLEKGRTEGRILASIDMIFSFLEGKGDFSKEQEDKIRNEKDLQILEHLVKLASKAESVEQFLNEIA